ncbi:MAG: hypothetical protein KGQ61_00335 [Planctomycetes bacterium]|nr:hypothetical protein [Planctomycetota bacterium]
MNAPRTAFATGAPGLSTHVAPRAGFDFSARAHHGSPTVARPAARRSPAPLALGRIAKDALLITLLLLLNSFGNVGAGVFFAILLGMTFYSPSAAFKALIIMWLGLMCNQALVPKSLMWTPCRLALPFISLTRFSFDLIALKASLFSKPFYVVFLTYCSVMAVCSVMSGWYTTIALIKLFNFFMACSAVFAGALVLVRKRIDIGEWLVSMIVSTTLIALLAIAFFNNGLVGVREDDPTAPLKHFGGAFLHPNCHSTYGSMYIVMLVMVFVYTNYRQRWIVWPLIAIWALFLVWSKARTSFVATALGLLTLLPFLANSVRSTWIRRANLSRTSAIAIALVACVGLLLANIVTGNAIGEAIIAFVNKSDRLSDTGQLELNVDYVLTSRIGKMEESLVNFRDNPIFGIGFQVAKSDYFIQNATLFTAPAEKGFLPTAVLEEGGLLGTPFFIAFILVLPLTFLAERNIPALAMFFTFMGTTMTEVTLFSPGGSGGFSWLMVGAAYVFGESTWIPKSPTSTTARPVSPMNAARSTARSMAPLPIGLPFSG